MSSKPKKSLLFTGILALGAAAALLSQRQKPADPRLNQPLVAGGLAAVNTVTIAKGEKHVVLVRAAGGAWHLDDAKGFAADAGAVARLTDELSQQRLAMVVGNRSQDGEFGLDVATTLTLATDASKVLTLNIGNQRKGGGGSYVRLADEEKSYLTSPGLTVSPDRDSWELKTLLKLPAEQVEDVVFTPPAGSGRVAAHLSRADAKASLTLVEPPAGKEANVAAAEMVPTDFTALNFQSRVDPSNAEAQAALAAATVIQVTTFDGRAYELRVGSVGEKTKKWFLQVAMPTQVADADPKRRDEALMRQAMNQTSAFAVAGWSAERLDKSLVDFLKAPPPPSPSAAAPAAKGKKKR